MDIARMTCHVGIDNHSKQVVPSRALEGIGSLTSRVPCGVLIFKRFSVHSLLGRAIGRGSSSSSSNPQISHLVDHELIWASHAMQRLDRFDLRLLLFGAAMRDQTSEGGC
uniref:Uncharacterized protein n=1 Tax=Guillardia theta TaxID=55529 RepID=A0A7S4KRX5_GUITH|mmetsp:Transcript_29839/g.95439  ORF Transcript_29839/g.95439 Transcript_29839/m.95439 type:complete len:110 (+) Transcript_29839:379-708(+)